jgi:hypothetical protein
MEPSALHNATHGREATGNSCGVREDGRCIDTRYRNCIVPVNAHTVHYVLKNNCCIDPTNGLGRVCVVHQQKAEGANHHQPHYSISPACHPAVVAGPSQNCIL